MPDSPKPMPETVAIALDQMDARWEGYLNAKNIIRDYCTRPESARTGVEELFTEQGENTPILRAGGKSQRMVPEAHLTELRGTIKELRNLVNGMIRERGRNVGLFTRYAKEAKERIKYALEYGRAKQQMKG